MNRARKAISADWAAAKWYKGEGVTVAVIDTGICKHQDFGFDTGRILAFRDFIYNKNTPYDDSGHGSHICGVIGGSGKLSDGKYAGVAPRCNFVVLKALDFQGDGNIPEVVQGLRWIRKEKERYNIRVLNLSFGTNGGPGEADIDLLIKEVEAVWDAGIVVVTAAGNGGPLPGSIPAPGSNRKVITVGAADDILEVEMQGRTRKNYSGRGPTCECIKKPDIVAPASNIISCNTMKNSRFVKGLKYVAKSGTSMATPMVTGAAALLLSAYPELSPKDVKIRLRESARDLGLSEQVQGWGMLDIKALLSCKGKV